MRAEAEGKAKEELENLESALKDAHQKVKDFADTPTEDLFKEEEEEFFEDKPKDAPIVLATEFAAEPETETNDATYYGIGAAAFSTIAAAAYLYRKRQTAKG